MKLLVVLVLAILALGLAERDEPTSMDLADNSAESSSDVSSYAKAEAHAEAASAASAALKEAEESESASLSPEGEEEESSSSTAQIGCVARPDKDLAHLCADVQEWVHDAGDTPSCDDVTALSNAKSLMNDTSCCHINFRSSEDISLLQVGQRVEHRLRAKIKATTATTANRVTRDELVARLEAVMSCDIPVIDYCEEKKHCVECERRKDGSLRKGFPHEIKDGQAHPGHWKEGEKTLKEIQEDEDCRKNPHCKSRGEEGYLADTQVAELRDPRKCKNIIDKAECMARLEDKEEPCNWLRPDSIADFERCGPCDTPDAIVSPCEDIEKCDVCEDAKVCIWNAEDELCQSRPAEVRITGKDSEEEASSAAEEEPVETPEEEEGDGAEEEGDGAEEAGADEAGAEDEESAAPGSATSTSTSAPEEEGEAAEAEDEDEDEESGRTEPDAGETPLAF